MSEVNFLLDFSPKWWLRVKNDEMFLKTYVIERFESNYYPRIIRNGKIKIDLDKSGKVIKMKIIKKTNQENFLTNFC
ncbi:MAG: hypothetical protein R3237_04500, partial [Nitrosopumilaceae archaeon]|nr:hypothetical protein [Nitrosopumilaceae archaeon]